MTIKEILNYGISKLKDKNIENASLKVKMVLSNVLNTTKEYLIINSEEVVSKENEEIFKININKLLEGYPIQYITNNQEFMKLNFFVDENVLIPQPDTEILVEEAIKLCSNKSNVKILDMCTGSGTIAISLAKYIKESEIYAVDISKEALEIATQNAKNNNVEIKCIKSDMFKNLQNIKFDMIVSNPPYIEENIIDTLSREVQYEPKLALNGGKDGLDFYRILANESLNFLNDEGILCLEIGYNQKDKVINILSNKYKDIYCLKDLENNDRVIVAKKGE